MIGGALQATFQFLSIQHFKPILYSSDVNYFIAGLIYVQCLQAFLPYGFFFLHWEACFQFEIYPVAKSESHFFLIQSPLSLPIILRFYCQVSLYICRVLNIAHRIHRHQRRKWRREKAMKCINTFKWTRYSYCE